MKENQLRDLICKKIEVIGSDLTLLDKEKYIPNTLGTKSFIDIYAKDRKNNHVLIELKRSNQAARQALHEVIKYAEGIKSHFGANDDEINLIIASTEWNELLVPFSSLIHNASYNIKGVKINVSGNDITTEVITPLKYNKGRFISPNYTAYWFKNDSRLDKGISSIKKALKDAGVLDCVVTILKSDNPIASPSKERRKEIFLELAKIQGIETKPVNDELFSYIAFLSFQTIPANEQLEIIKRTKNKETYEEALYAISGLNEQQQIEVLCEYTFDLPSILYDDIEVGNPAKLSHYLGTTGIRLKEIIREGFFKENLNLTDEIILQELTGDKGNSAQKLKLIVDLQKKQQVSNLKDKIDEFFETNNIWKNQISQIINETQKNHPKAIIELQIYHPRMGLFSIYYTLKNFTSSEFFLPNYIMLVTNDEGEVLKEYYGFLKENNSKKTLKELIDKYYEGDIQNLIYTITWGGTEDRDEDILDDAGLSYMSFCRDISDGKSYALINNKWREHSTTTPLNCFGEFVENNSEFIDNLIGEISFYDQGNKFCPPEIDTHIIIEKSEVKKSNVSKIQDFFEIATSSKAMARHLQGKIDITFSGYDDDGELFMIEEVRSYLREISDRFNYFFFFINPHGVSGILKILFLCFTKINSYTIEKAGKMNLDIDFSDGALFLQHQFVGLNALTDFCDMTIEENKKITYLVMRSIGISH
ncbi:endonuclease NucS domain-containing protein [Pantoea piersonii]|uniref:endonuclease NucS domain-containing protein n=1 Tax=Pantoea piersonii TaxID=2364647 RepID=UPI0022F1CDBB|nr:endonuclease NucS domain-containing protein [Pantoea piersonii]WBV22597.1 endonuclease NucS [Pantoea piersonii]